MLAVAVGLALTIVLSGLISDVYGSALQDSIRLETGHLQLRADSYETEKVSLQWEDLVNDSTEMATLISTMDQVAAAAARFVGNQHPQHD